MPSVLPETADVAASMILDLDHLRRQTCGDLDLEADLLALFSRQAQGIAMDLAATGAGAPRRAELLHLLVGSARAIGAWEVALRAQELERESRGAAPLPQCAETTLLALAAAVQQVCDAIERRTELEPGSQPPAPVATRR